jgi:transposase
MKVKERVYVMKKVDKMTWEDIASHPKVKNLQGEAPYWQVVRDAYRELSGPKGSVKKDKYHKCGRKALLSDELVKWLVKKTLALRMKTDCSSTDLQRLLAKENHVAVDASTIRRALNGEGYYYLPRGRKSKHDKVTKMNARAHVSFSEPFDGITTAAQKKKLHMCMDGVAWTMPPAKEVARENYIHTDTPKVSLAHIPVSPTRNLAFVLIRDLFFCRGVCQPRAG